MQESVEVKLKNYSGMYIENYSDGTGKYLRIKGDDTDRVSDRIITKGVIKGLLPVQIQWVDGMREYVYETTGYIGYDQYISEQSTKKEDIVRLYRQIYETVKNADEYLLDPAHLYLDPECIYIRQEDKKIGLIFVAEQEMSASECINLISEKTLSVIEDADGELCGMIYRMHRFAGNNDVSWKGFLQFLEKETTETIVNSENENAKNDPGSRNANSDVDVYQTKKPVMIKKTLAPAYSRAKKDYLKPLPICISGIGIIVPFVLLKAGIFTDSLTGKTDVLTSVFAFVFFVAVAFYGAYRVADEKQDELVLDEEDELSVCLVPEKRGATVVPIKNFPFKLGKDKNKVDAMLMGDGISDVHAHLKKEGDKVFLTDDESAGGTFLNERRLAPWECVRLNDGDRVSFGTIGYVVEIIM